MFVHLCSINIKTGHRMERANPNQRADVPGVCLGSGHYALGTPGAALHVTGEFALARGFGEQGLRKKKTTV